ncbi:chromosome segregation protein SMC [Olsenella sp. oral taxon 809 str. F0356]|uniref:chromosome segregation protein SMC n=1 Tax=Olsenella sp. oral taxon 809 TaxID=661086 RepID=UPI000231F33D|nr:chromosome segregation protein SMC [Olsenella sp. oral taxon 809]EHF01899.1 chromosome segregation protein SMC [Olsenella sp. oral taxon 809 str. F0356]
MYLKSLTLKGFKSFADRTNMVFDPGLTVVVGPNGSGKSNISDAILWVLGEQSAKMLRGQAMEDVIFSGSSGRAAVGLAEVTLVLDNVDHTLPIDFSEVAVTRRMYRSGESEYLINGAPSRLRDITDILHDSGLGKDTHSIISQGKLDSILASRPEERRELVEEAAGISKHRRRKDRSERKLQAMQDNLTRAKDIQREIGRQLKPLERQVDKAQRHRSITGELSTLTTTLAVDDLRQLQQRYQALADRGREADAAVELAQYRLDERNAELERYQSLLEQKGIFVGDLGEQRRRMQDLLGRMDSDMRLLEEKGRNMVSRLSETRRGLSALERQRVDAAAELERVTGELLEARALADDLRGKVAELGPAAKEAKELRRSLGSRQAQLTADQRAAQREADQETLAYAKLSDQISNAQVEDQMFESRLAQIEDGVATATESLSERRGRREELEGALASAREEDAALATRINGCKDGQRDARKAENDARHALSDARARLSALEFVDRQAQNSSALVGSLSAGRLSSTIRYRVADLVEAPSELEGLVESLLGDDLGGLVVSTGEELVALAREAASSKAKGRASLLSLEGRGRELPGDGLPGRSLLAELVPLAGAEALVAGLLGDVRLVDDVASAIEAHASHPEACYVTAEGAMALPDGRVVVGNASTAEQGALERKRRIRQLRGDLPRLEGALGEASQAAQDSELRLQEAREASARAKGEVARLAGELSSVTGELGRLEAQLRQAESERAQVTKGREAAAQRASRACEEVERHRAAADEATARAASLGEELEEVSAQRQRASREESDAEGRLSDARLKLATVSERRNHLAVREEELLRQLADLDRRRGTMERSARALDVLQLRVEPLHGRYEAVRERALAWAARLKDRASLAEADSDSLKKTISDAREAVAQASRELDAARESSGEVKVESGKIEVQVQNAIQSIEGSGWGLDDALRLPEPDDRAQMERDVARLKGDLAHIGPVNEVAMDEYERLKERADYIGEQVEDLESARKSLQKITAAIERKMRRQFLVVFDQVNANFSEIFSLLFPGGHAHLEMCDPDHLDETGIEIVAQPRGKRIQKMTLMSGGEKSLTALALLFAVYKTRTVPFYVFDEVEAALDDSNLSKLLDAIERLKDSTQLIVISHQRRTMEQADVLYGVSMQADGVSHVVSQRLDRASGKVVEA